MEITEQLPTECLVCRNDAGDIVTTECDNPNCDDGLIWPDTDEEG